MLTLRHFFLTPDGAATASLATMPTRAPEPGTLALHDAPLNEAFAVHEVVYPNGGAAWPQRLEELGFLPGERVMVTARGWPNGDPLAVRVGHSTFALRRAEAACVHVRPWSTP